MQKDKMADEAQSNDMSYKYALMTTTMICRNTDVSGWLHNKHFFLFIGRGTFEKKKEEQIHKSQLIDENIQIQSFKQILFEWIVAQVLL